MEAGKEEELLSMVREKIPETWDDMKPGNPWLGKAMKRLGLMKGKRGNKQQKIVYLVDIAIAIKLLGDNGALGNNSEI